MKKKGQLEKRARRLLTKSADIVMSEGDKHEEMCGLVDVIADLLFAGRLSDIDPTKSVEEIEKYMSNTQHLILHGLFLAGVQYERDMADKPLPDSSPGSFDDVSIDDILKGLGDNG